MEIKSIVKGHDYATYLMLHLKQRSQVLRVV